MRAIPQLILNNQFDSALFGKLPDCMNEFYTIDSIGLPRAIGGIPDMLKILTRMEMHWLDKYQLNI